MKYRIIELANGYYPQEKKYFFSKWEYLDNISSNYTRDAYERYHSFVATYEQALEVVERRKQYLKDKKFKKIHNL
jgi:hypothetical protein